jgi:hypothetical protein
MPGRSSSPSRKRRSPHRNRSGSFRPKTSRVPEPLPPCACGCGVSVGSPWAQFIRGHSTRVRMREIPPRICPEEGCEEPLKRGRKWCDVHRSSKPGPRPKPVPAREMPSDVPCECGCGEFPRVNRRFVQNHYTGRPKQGEVPHWLEPFMKEEMTSLCARCGYTETGAAEDVIKAMKKHRSEHRGMCPIPA